MAGRLRGVAVVGMLLTLSQDRVQSQHPVVLGFLLGVFVFVVWSERLPRWLVVGAAAVGGVESSFSMRVSPLSSTTHFTCV